MHRLPRMYASDDGLRSPDLVSQALRYERAIWVSRSEEVVCLTVRLEHMQIRWVNVDSKILLRVREQSE